jgi:hypothetical protein
VFCGRHLLAAKLRPSNIDASAGSVEEVARTCLGILRSYRGLDPVRVEAVSARAVELGVLNCKGVASLLARKRDPAAAKDSRPATLFDHANLRGRLDGLLEFSSSFVSWLQAQEAIEPLVDFEIASGQRVRRPMAQARLSRPLLKPGATYWASRIRRAFKSTGRSSPVAFKSTCQKPEIDADSRSNLPLSRERRMFKRQAAQG